MVAAAGVITSQIKPDMAVPCDGAPLRGALGVTSSPIGGWVPPCQTAAQTKDGALSLSYMTSDLHTRSSARRRRSPK